MYNKSLIVLSRKRKIERSRLETNNLKNDFSSDFQSESRMINPINLHLVISEIREHPPI